MANSDSVPACIKALSSTTFVAEVTAPALAVLVPLLIRALNDRSMEVQRRSVVVIDNLVKLVRDPNVAAAYLSPLVDGVQKIATGAAFPEVRAFGDAALKTLLKSGASASGPPPIHRDIDAEAREALATLKTILPEQLAKDGASSGNAPKTPKFQGLEISLAFQAEMVADLVYARNFHDPAAWKRCVAKYMSIWLDEALSSAFAEDVLGHYLAIDRVSIFFIVCYHSNLV